jgi:hypothetical protein
VGGLTARVAAAEKLRSGGHASDRKACVEAKKVAAAGHPSNGENLKTSKFTLEGLVFLVIK